MKNHPNSAKWGTATARERYGKPAAAAAPPADQHEPQFEADKHGAGYDNLVPANSWLRSDGTKKPGFDGGRKGK